MPATSTIRTLLRERLPWRLVRCLRRWRRRRSFTGHYHAWPDALAASKGYADVAVLQKVVAATRAVAEGRALWDRDGAVFQTEEVNAPLLAALRRIAEEEGGGLDLVDFGGALGSTWRQHRRALQDPSRVRWRVVEQAHYVEAGREFADHVLRFHPTLEEAMAGGTVSTVLFSSVLPYVEQPRAFLEEVVRRQVRHVILDRTSFAVDGQARLVVQHAPAALGGGSYPCWLFNRDELMSPLAGHYRLVEEWPGFDDVDPSAVYRGSWFKRIA